MLDVNRMSFFEEPHLNHTFFHDTGGQHPDSNPKPLAGKSILIF